MRFFRKLFAIPNTPSYLPLREFNGPDCKDYCWEDWKKTAKEEYPVRFFLSRTFSLWFTVKITMRIEHLIYWIQSHTYRRQHLLDLRQPKVEVGFADSYRWGYLDYDQQILYACFNSLVGYVECLDKCTVRYNVPESIKVYREALWNAEDPDNATVKLYLDDAVEVLDLYNYWTDRRKRDSREIDTLRSDWHKNRHSDPERTKWNKLRAAEKAFDDEELEILIRLMKIRHNLWI